MKKQISQNELQMANINKIHVSSLLIYVAKTFKKKKNKHQQRCKSVLLN